MKGGVQTDVWLWESFWKRKVRMGLRTRQYGQEETRSILMVRKRKYSPKYKFPRKGESRTCDTYTESEGNDFKRGTDSVPSAAGTQSFLSGQTIPIRLG